MCSGSVSQCTWVRQEFRLAMHVGSCTVWNTVYNPMVKCPLIRLWGLVMTRSILSSLRLALANTSLEPSSSTLNPPSLVSRSRSWLDSKVKLRTQLIYVLHIERAKSCNLFSQQIVTKLRHILYTYGSRNIKNVLQMSRVYLIENR